LNRFLALLMSLLLLGGVSAQEVDPSTERAAILIMEMGRNLAGLESFSVRSESTFDEPVSGQLVEHSQTTDVLVSRSKGFRMNTDGDLMRSSAYFNGTDFVMYDRNRKFFAVTPFSGTLHDLTDHAAKRLGVILPAAELLRKHPGEAFMENVDTLFYVGLNTVNGRPCHHVAARNKSGIEWELWIDENVLLPRKIVVRDPGQPGVPRSVAVLSRWNLNPALPDMVFHFLIPPEAVEIEFKLPENGEK
jgi:hypothetical protein